MNERDRKIATLLELIRLRKYERHLNKKFGGGSKYGFYTRLLSSYKKQLKDLGVDYEDG